MSADGDTYTDFNQRLIADLRANAGRATSGPFGGRNLLILTTRGARSGETRENPLAFSKAGDAYVVVASKGGSPTNPAWYHNLVANPDVGVEVDGRSFQTSARLAEGEEYDRLFKAHADRMPGFWDYKAKTQRKMPVILLEPPH
jgi:deazaflavin-dependent oxidoreductase (nitroreductase family)